MKLSVVMAVYNERATLREVVAQVLKSPQEIDRLKTILERMRQPQASAKE